MRKILSLLGDFMHLRWIDALKGFAIIMVVVGHMNIPSNLLKYIFSFHMPLFFFIAGYLSNLDKYLNSPESFLKNKFKSLIIPYFSFTIMAYVYCLIFDAIYQPEIRNIKIFSDGFSAEVYEVLYSTGSDLLNYPLWFLTCLFATETLFYFIVRKYSHQRNKLLLLIIFISIIGYLYPLYINFRLPWNFDIALTSIVFYSTGYQLRKYYSKNERPTSLYKNTSLLIGFFCIHIFLLFIVGKNIPRFDLNTMIYGNYFLFYMITFSGIFTYIFLFQGIKQSRILEFYGRNSLIILGLHIIISDFLSDMTEFLDLNIISPKKNILSFISFIFLVLVLMLPIIKLINRYFPLLIGKKETNRKELLYIE